MIEVLQETQVPQAQRVSAVQLVFLVRLAPEETMEHLVQLVQQAKTEQLAQLVQ